MAPARQVGRVPGIVAGAAGKGENAMNGAFPLARGAPVSSPGGALAPGWHSAPDGGAISSLRPGYRRGSMLPPKPHSGK